MPQSAVIYRVLVLVFTGCSKVFTGCSKSMHPQPQLLERRLASFGSATAPKNP